MAASVSLLFFIVIILLLIIGSLSLRLRRNTQRLTEAHKEFQAHQEFLLSHLCELAEYLHQMPDRTVVWNPSEDAWQVKGELGAEGIMAYLSRCRSYAQEQANAGESRESVDAIVGLTLERLLQKNPRYHEQVRKLLTEEELTHWLNGHVESTRRYCA